jgi:hypothetical protein
MKIRLGFVSNSSSASFTVVSNITKNDFLDLLARDNPFYNRESVKKSIKSWIDKYVKYHGELKEKLAKIPATDAKNSLEQLWLNQNESVIDKHTKILMKFDSLTDAEVVTLLLDLSGYHVSEDIFNMVEISGSTGMWNGEEDIGENLIDIKKFLQERGYKIKLYVDCDS